MAAAALKLSSIINPAECKYKVRWSREGEVLGESSELMPDYLAEHLAKAAAAAYPNLTFEVYMAIEGGMES